MIIPGWRLLFLLIAVSAIGPLTLNGVLPATSAIMVDLSTQYDMAQLVLTVFLLANLLSQLVLGPAADRIGRKPVMLFSLFVYVLGSIGCASAGSIEALLAGRFVQGIGAAVCVFLPRTIVRDCYARDRAASVIGYITTAMMVAPMFGPAIGGWITDNTSWRFMYVGLAALGCVLLVSAWRYQPETLSVQKEQPKRGGTLILLRDPLYLAYAAMLTGVVGVYYGFLSGAPYVAMESMGLSASSYGAWFSVVALGYLSGNLTAGRFSERVGVHGMIWRSYIPFLLGIALFWAFYSMKQPAGLFLPMMLVAFSNGICLPNMFSAAMSVRQEYAATASGIAGSLQTGFGVLLSIFAGVLIPQSDIWLLVLLSLSAMLSAAGLWFILLAGNQAVRE